MANSINWKWLGKAQTWLDITQRQCCVEAQIWGRPETNSAALEAHKSTVASIFLKWKRFGIIKTLSRAGCPDTLSNWGRRALVKEVTNLMVDLVEFRDRVEMGRVISNFTGLNFIIEWAAGSLSSLKTCGSILWKRPENWPNSHVHSLLASYPKRLEAVLATKGASAKCWVKLLYCLLQQIYMQGQNTL